jgi:hypothetical protein
MLLANFRQVLNCLSGEITLTYLLWTSKVKKIVFYSNGAKRFHNLMRQFCRSRMFYRNGSSWQNVQKSNWLKNASLTQVFVQVNLKGNKLHRFTEKYPMAYCIYSLFCVIFTF